MTDKLADKIPDIHFDWYARIIPGAIAIIYYFYMTKTIPEITSSYLLVYAFTAYILGHVIQPLSSFGIKIIYKKNECDESLFSTSKKKEELSHATKLVDKAHAEATGMFSSFILILAIYMYIKSLEGFHLNKEDIISYFMLLYFLFASFERAKARKRKINDLK